MALKALGETELGQLAHRVREQIDANTEPFQLGRGLEHSAGDAGFVQAEGEREACHPAADDENVPGILRSHLGMLAWRCSRLSYDKTMRCVFLSLLAALVLTPGTASAQSWPSRPVRLIVSPELNVKTLAELIALAKANPGKLAFASPGQRTLPGMLGEMLKIRAGIDLLHVPYKGAQGVQDTVAGRTQLTIQGIPAIAAVVQRGQLRALAVSSPRRLPELPDVPTFSETLPGFEFNGWVAVVAPTGTPPAAIHRMNLEFNPILLDGETEPKIRALGIYTEGTGPPEEIDAFLKSERAFWSRVVRELKIEPE